MTDTTQPTIQMPPLCNTHRALLVKQCCYGPADPWQALEIATQIALIQGATCDSKVYAEIGGDITRLVTIGCLACRKPDLFGHLVDKVQRTFPRSAHVGAIELLGEQ